MERQLLGLFVFIFCLNFWFLSVFGGGCDLATHISWGRRLFSQPLEGFYARNPDVDHLPGYLLMLRGSGWLEARISFLARYFPPEFIFKLPAVFADLATGLLVFSILKRKKVKEAISSLPLYLLNAAVFYNSLLWGQFDGVVALFLVVAFFALEKKKPVLAGLSLGLGGVTKPSNLFYLPFFSLWAFFDLPGPSFFLLLVSLAFSFLLPFLVFLKGPLFALPSFIVERFSYVINRQPQVSSGAPNFWGLTPFFRIDDDRLPGPFGLAFQNWGLGLFFVFWLICLVLFSWSKRKRKKSPLAASFLFSLLALAIFLFPTRVHERHLFFLFPFLLITSFLDPAFFPFYLVYSLTSAITIAFTLYSPQRGFNLWASREMVGWLSAVNLLGFLGLFIFGLKRVILPQSCDKIKRK